jgi:glycosyltransferase involved in cell wall biosynthesis
VRILQLNPAFYPAFAYGGTVNVSYHLSKALAEKGHDVAVYTSDTLDKHSRQKNRYMEHQGIRINYFKNVSNLLAWHRFPFYPGLVAALKKNIKDFDIVHLHGTRNFQNIVATHYAKKYGIPYIVQPHGSLPRMVEKQNLKKIFDVLWGNDVLKNASKVIAVSETESKQLIQARIPQEKIVVIPNGVDDASLVNPTRLGQFREQNNITDKYLILYVGRINKLKGIDFLIRAYKLFLETWIGRDVVLVIGGPDDGNQSSLEALVEQLGLKDNVKFTGFISSPEMAYRDADILVYPSTYEIFGLVPFESLLHGTPIIVTDNCGCGGIIKDAKCGYLVRYGDETSLAELLKFALTHPDVNKKMVEAGKRYIEARLNWKCIVEQVERVYTDCIL